MGDYNPHFKVEKSDIGPKNAHISKENYLNSE